MENLTSSALESYAKKIFNELKSDESISMSLFAEATLFTRLSQAKIRQITNLEQANLDYQFIKGQKKINFTLPFKSNDEDLFFAIKKLNEIRSWYDKLPDDPYLIHPTFHGVTKEENIHDMPSNDEMLSGLFEQISGVDLAGVFSSGDIIRANINSVGQFHWFKTKNFYLDYSLYNDKQKAVKSLYAGSEWNPLALTENITDSKYKLSLMNRPSRKIERGSYRTYLAPSAVGELLGTLSWGGVSMGDHQRGNGSLLDLWKGNKKLSHKFSLSEDFSLGLSPRFNDIGEMSPMTLPIIEKGEFKNFLTSSRTAKEYKVESNQASGWEGMRSPVIGTGNLARDQILKELDTGLYLSDLHYLNWSDRETARLTGMTRYACFWVEKGEIVSPIEDLRFDESYYSLFGDDLAELTNFADIIPQTGSYFQRDVGGAKAPGLLVNNFKFTL